MRILRYLDLDDVEVDKEGQPVPTSVTLALSKIQEDLPKLFSEGAPIQVGAGSRGSDKPVGDHPLSREEIERMSPEELKEPSVMQRVDRWLQGQR